MNRAHIPDTRFAVAFSGGGDSTALVHMLRGKNPLVLIVDHGLRTGSDLEARNAKTFAEGLGLEARVLRWAHDNPNTGLQEKARRARYGLMGQVCREEGITELLTGHTEDDQAETLLMRYDRKTDWRGAAGMRERVYAPVWPELASVTLVRPLMGMRRKDLRNYNQEHKLTWAEDPSNANRGFTRIRARDHLQNRDGLRQELLNTARELTVGLEAERLRFASFVDRHVMIDAHGIVKLTAVPPKHLLELLLRVVSGTGDVIAKQSLIKLQSAMLEDEFSGTTLGGSMVIKRGKGFVIGRDPGVAKGRANHSPMPEVELIKDVSIIWDGRFQITAEEEGLGVYTFENAQVPKALKKETYRQVPHKLRSALPHVSKRDNDPKNTQVELSDAVNIEQLVACRLQAVLKMPVS